MRKGKKGRPPQMEGGYRRATTKNFEGMKKNRVKHRELETGRKRPLRFATGGG